MKNEIIKKYDSFHEEAKEIDNFLFMNDGFVYIDEFGYPKEFNLSTSEKFKNWRYQVLFYDFLLKCVDIDVKASSKKSILDVGCGRGGGLLFYKENYNFYYIIFIFK